LVVFSISGHGFGHAARSIEVINALRAARPEVPILVRTSAPRWLFDLTVSGHVRYVHRENDVGVVQVDALTPDLPATLQRADEFYGDLERRVRDEADALGAAGARLVVADAPPLAFAAAARAQIPSVALTNFTWDWIYEDYARALRIQSPVPGIIRRLHEQAHGAWRLPFAGPFQGFRAIRDLPLVARHARRRRDDTRAAFGWLDDRPVVLASFGGVPFSANAADQAARDRGLRIVATGDPRAARDAAAPLTSTLSTGVVALNDARLYHDGWRYEDLIAAVDVVVTKPGYGIVSECIANGAAMLYTSRGRFAEYDVLVQEMRRWLRCRFIPQEELRAGHWGPHVRALLSEPATAERPLADGAEVAARWISEMLA
jgi:L-arabinokinase